jgi:hypothetical protein
LRDLKWSPSEKKVARTAFDAALDSALTKVMAEFKVRAIAATTSSDMMFDYRYSQLPFVFARLIHEGHLDESRLAGLSEEKRELIRSCLSLTERR